MSREYAPCCSSGAPPFERDPDANLSQERACCQDTESSSESPDQTAQNTDDYTSAEDV